MQIELFLLCWADTVLEPTVSALDRVDFRPGGTCLSDRNISPKD